MYFFILQNLSGVLSMTYSGINAFVSAYGYVAVFIMMTLESIGIPIPSEVLLPLVGHFIATGLFNPIYATVVVLTSSMLGIAIDYFVAYYLGKDVIYKHLNLLHIKKENLDAFEVWFRENGAFAVFIGRFIPEVRALISIPAGLAMMPKKQFFVYSFFGALIWDLALMTFGYYALSTSNVSLTIAAIAVFVIILYLIYRHFRKSMLKGKK